MSPLAKTHEVNGIIEKIMMGSDHNTVYLLLKDDPLRYYLGYAQLSDFEIGQNVYLTEYNNSGIYWFATPKTIYNTMKLKKYL